MKKERILQIILISIITFLILIISSCASNYQSCSAYDYHRAK